MYGEERSGLAHSSGEAGRTTTRKERSWWSEGAGPRGTRNSHTCAGHRAGKHVTEAVTRAEAAKQRKKERFTALFHLLTVEALEAVIPLPEQESGRRSGWHQVDGLRRKHEEQHNRSAPEATSGQLEARSPAGVTTSQKRMENNACRSASALAGGQDRPVCAGENP